MLGVLPVISTAAIARVSASGTGIGIRLDGPIEAQVNQTICYAITVINLGNYWDRNLTVTNQFPDGTSSSWSVPDLAPLSKPGDEYSITGISYTIRPGDLLSEPPLHVDDFARVDGYVNVSGLLSLVQAETDFPTIITVVPPPSVVGGYSVLLEPKCSQASSITCIIRVFAFIALSVYLFLQFRHTRIYPKEISDMISD